MKSPHSLCSVCASALPRPLRDSALSPGRGRIYTPRFTDGNLRKGQLPCQTSHLLSEPVTFLLGQLGWALGLTLGVHRSPTQCPATCDHTPVAPSARGTALTWACAPRCRAHTARNGHTWAKPPCGRPRSARVNQRTGRPGHRPRAGVVTERLQHLLPECSEKPADLGENVNLATLKQQRTTACGI